MPKQAIIHSSLQSVQLIETPIPIPKGHEVVIKVVVSGTNPKDWKYPLWKTKSHNSGDDVAGIVHSVGSKVYEFKPGDRVAGLHEFGTENGSFAEYAVTLDHTTFRLPHDLSFEEAATVPLAALTAAIALYNDMGLPPPYALGSREESGNKTPLLIYGVTSAVGAFAAKFARLSGLSPIIGVVGRGGGFAKTLCDHVIDYRKGEDALVISIEEFLAKKGLGSKVPNVFDAISENGSLEATLRFIEPDGGIVATVLPPKMFAKDKDNFKYPEGVTAINSAVPQVFSTAKDFGYVWSRYLGRLLDDGRLTRHPYEVIPGGLNGILTGLTKLKNGEASAVKYVYRIEETQDVAVPRKSVAASDASDYAEYGQSAHAMRLFPFPGQV